MIQGRIAIQIFEEPTQESIDLELKVLSDDVLADSQAALICEDVAKLASTCVIAKSINGRSPEIDLTPQTIDDSEDDQNKFASPKVIPRSLPNVADVVSKELVRLVVILIEWIEIKLANSSTNSISCLEGFSAHKVFVEIPAEHVQGMTRLAEETIILSADMWLNSMSKVSCSHPLIFDPGGGLSGASSVTLYDQQSCISVVNIANRDFRFVMNGQCSLPFDRGKYISIVLHVKLSLGLRIGVSLKYDKVGHFLLDRNLVLKLEGSGLMSLPFDRGWFVVSWVGEHGILSCILIFYPGGAITLNSAGCSNVSGKHICLPASIFN